MKRVCIIAMLFLLCAFAFSQELKEEHLELSRWEENGADVFGRDFSVSPSELKVKVGETLRLTIKGKTLQNTTLQGLFIADTSKDWAWVAGTFDVNIPVKAGEDFCYSAVVPVALVPGKKDSVVYGVRFLALEEEPALAFADFSLTWEKTKDVGFSTDYTLTLRTDEWGSHFNVYIPLKNIVAKSGQKLEITFSGYTSQDIDANIFVQDTSTWNVTSQKKTEEFLQDQHFEKTVTLSLNQAVTKKDNVSLVLFFIPDDEETKTLYLHNVDIKCKVLK